VENDEVPTAEILRLSVDPGRVEVVRALLREYILLPDGWEALGFIPVELPDFFAEEISQFPGSAAPPSGEVLVATHRSVVVGFGEVVPLEGDTCEFKRVYVVSKHQGFGFGRLLAGALVEEAHHLGYRRVVLDVVPSRQRARALWTSVGFEEIGPYRAYPFPMIFMALGQSDAREAPHS
jgi:putative acetyltransferase